MSEITLFEARNIITMDVNRPLATHVAVREGEILAVGGEDCAQQWGTARLDRSLKHAVLMPGFVEGHAHMTAGAIWRYAYAGYHDRYDPSGVLWPGLRDIDAFIIRMRERLDELQPEMPLIGWGFDPIFLPGERLNRHHLDRISRARPVAIMFSNFHIMCVNSVALEMAGLDSTTDAEGVTKDSAGEPTGELREHASMFPVMHRLNIDFRGLNRQPDSIRAYAEVARRVGVTTATDLFSRLQDCDIDTMLQVTGQTDFMLRIVPALAAQEAPMDVAKRAMEIRKRSRDNLRLGAVKIMTDGAIQGWTARVKSPGYVGGKPNGIWNTPPERIFALVEEMHQCGIQMHIHVNGDEAAEVTLDALEAALCKHPWPSHRHVLQHCQLMGRDLYRRAAELGVCCNIFANHIWYFGDQHAAITIGEDRALRMDACRTALDVGVNIAIHSDAPVTPMAPLFTAWCAVNRKTMSERTLGAAQCISVQEALFAITMGAAYTLKLDGEIGSVETGKRADFAILGADPYEVDPMNLKDVEVLGTVFGGAVNLL
ncbi:amidohydrolase [Hoeflea sp. CAU 1731]